jgi:RNA-directed DNA polymerase
VGLLSDIARGLDISEGEIAKIAATAPRRYKVFAIPKRSGLGHRIIAQPSRKVKAIQRYVMSQTLRGLPVHPMATAYRIGKSIADNAAPHAQRRVILKLDFRDFFHSITPPDLDSIVKISGLAALSGNERGLLTSILFWRHPLENRLCLSIGAPSSPFISNAVMEPLDRAFDGAVRDCWVTYTRYADDITLSADTIENLLKAERRIRHIVAGSERPKLTFNDDKRGVFTTAGRRIVTGLVLTPDGKISLGRERKRSISAALHHIATGRNVARDHREQTRGWLAHAKSVEPSFLEAMARKYPTALRAVMNMPLSPAMSPADVELL